MKDDNLEKQFDEYFKGVNTPENITADAKKYVKPAHSTPVFWKFASVAASLVLVCAISVALIMRGGFTIVPDSTDNAISTYNDSNLSRISTDVYNLAKLSPSLKIIQNFAYAENAAVNVCDAYYSENNLTLVSADVSLLKGLTRQDAKIYVEFTPENEVYEPLESYRKGEEGYVYDTAYNYSFAYAENGEPVTYIYLYTNSVKYYLQINSSDSNAYMYYLAQILK